MDMLAFELKAIRAKNSLEAIEERLITGLIYLATQPRK